MELGVILPNSGAFADPQAILAVAEAAEGLGYDALWTADHLVLPIETQTNYPYVRGAKIRLDPSHAFFEPLIALAAVATKTTRIRLGVSVYLAALRHPIAVAKQVASLDRLSNGRMILGVGAGWIPEEYATLGIPFAERGRFLDEHIEAMRSLWRDEAPRYAGEHYRFDGIGFEPKPLQRDVPIWVGGNSPAARRRAARLGDGWHVIDVPMAELEAGIGALAIECHAAGRLPGSVSTSIRSQIALTARPVPEAERMVPLTGPVDVVLADLRRYRALGVAHVALWPASRPERADDYVAAIERLAREIVAPLRADASRGA
ncbi:MAG: LLM class F420-dependent oxidoreductase [Deltaproteobacteria bacterium]|nr:LLM class F420-dependent oxidoreductase [Deltaproteobacteria bacterium]